MLKRKADFELDFDLFNARISQFDRVGGQKVIWKSGDSSTEKFQKACEPECFTGNSKWLFLLKLPKSLVNSASERKLRKGKS